MDFISSSKSSWCCRVHTSGKKCCLCEACSSLPEKVVCFMSKLYSTQWSFLCENLEWSISPTLATTVSKVPNKLAVSYFQRRVKVLFKHLSDHHPLIDSVGVQDWCGTTFFVERINCYCLAIRFPCVVAFSPTDCNWWCDNMSKLVYRPLPAFHAVFCYAIDLYVQHQLTGAECIQFRYPTWSNYLYYT